MTCNKAALADIAVARNMKLDAVCACSLPCLFATCLALCGTQICDLLQLQLVLLQ